MGRTKNPAPVVPGSFEDQQNAFAPFQGKSIFGNFDALAVTPDQLNKRGQKKLEEAELAGEDLSFQELLDLGFTAKDFTRNAKKDLRRGGLLSKGVFAPRRKIDALIGGTTQLGGDEASKQISQAFEDTQKKALEFLGQSQDARETGLSLLQGDLDSKASQIVLKNANELFARQLRGAGKGGPGALQQTIGGAAALQQMGGQLFQAGAAGTQAAFGDLFTVNPFADPAFNTSRSDLRFDRQNFNNLLQKTLNSIERGEDELGGQGFDNLIDLGGGVVGGLGGAAVGSLAGPGGAFFGGQVGSSIGSKLSGFIG
jgi:hypothetical protein